MALYTSITVIYNPKSTGSGRDLSKDFKDKLSSALPDLAITVKATKHAGHAREIAYTATLATKRPLIISASGDGGYNEVINGVMEAKEKHPDSSPTTGLLAAGNANDHFNSLHQDNIVKLITTNREQMIDVLKLTTTTGKKATVRYAHSYIGLGLTPQVGLELNKTDLNPLVELLVSIKALLLLRPVRVVINGRTQRYSSLIFSNIDRMAKYLTLSKNSSITDGKFEIITFGATNRLKLLSNLLKASTVGLNGRRHESHFELTTTQPTKLQVDGEVISLSADTHLSVTCEQQTLRCIV